MHCGDLVKNQKTIPPTSAIFQFSGCSTDSALCLPGVSSESEESPAHPSCRDQAGMTEKVVSVAGVPFFVGANVG